MLQRLYLRKGNCYVTELTLGESPNILILTRYYILYILYILGIWDIKNKLVFLDFTSMYVLFISTFKSFKIYLAEDIIQLLSHTDKSSSFGHFFDTSGTNISTS